MNDVQSSKAKARPASGRALWKWGAAAATGAALAGTALFNRSRAKRAERENPPLGRIVTVDGVRLHYLERGEGRPLVLLHGNGTMIEDWIVSGLLDELARSYRVIAFDRPGFGHSERPRSRIWTPTAQAALLTQAFRELEVERPLVVGHSFGALVTVALAISHPQALSGIVLLGGYYYPSVRADVPLIAPAATPVVGDVMRHTASPLLGAALMPRINAKIFEPAPVPQRWLEEFPIAMSLRPAQIRAEAAEAGLMVPAAAALAGRFAELHLPVTIVAGESDAIVETSSQARPLHKAIPQSRLIVVEGAGHMVHHTAPDQVIAAVRAM
jgi:pimeloyl-ACP methyl ester carboxylesterase